MLLTLYFMKLPCVYALLLVLVLENWLLFIASGWIDPLAKCGGDQFYKHILEVNTLLIFNVNLNLIK